MKSENSRTIRKGNPEVSYQAIILDIIELGPKAGTSPQRIEG